VLKSFPPEALTKAQFLLDWADTKLRYEMPPAKSRFFHFWPSRNPPAISNFHTLYFIDALNYSFERNCSLFGKIGGGTPKLPKMEQRKMG
jgi:hypothetical protein